MKSESCTTSMFAAGAPTTLSVPKWASIVRVVVRVVYA